MLWSLVDCAAGDGGDPKFAGLRSSVRLLPVSYYYWRYSAAGGTIVGEREKYYHLYTTRIMSCVRRASVARGLCDIYMAATWINATQRLGEILAAMPYITSQLSLSLSCSLNPPPNICLCRRDINNQMVTPSRRRKSRSFDVPINDRRTADCFHVRQFSRDSE